VLSDTHEPGTVKVRYRGLHRFCGWLVEEGELSDNPMSTLSPPTLKMKPVPVISDDELTALLKACTGKEFADRRDEALIRLRLDCGVRVSEACGLRVDDVDLDQGMAIVTGKGNKVRPIYFGARTVRALDRYLRMRAQHRWAHLDALFLTQRGALSPDGARDRVTLRGQLAGRDHVYPHRFRHTFAHDFLMTRRTGTRPKTAGRLVLGRDVGTLRRQRSRRTGQSVGAATQERRQGMTVLDLIHNHDPQVRLLCAGHCDCTPERRLFCSIYAHQETRHLYLPTYKGRHATSGAPVKREPVTLRLEPGAVFTKITECGRCRGHYVVSSAPVASAFISIRLGLPAEDPFEENQYVATLKVPVDGAVEVLPGLFVTPLDKSTFGQVAPD
jgi:hypothetical protein